MTTIDSRHVSCTRKHKIQMQCENLFSIWFALFFFKLFMWNAVYPATGFALIPNTMINTLTVSLIPLSYVCLLHSCVILCMIIRWLEFNLVFEAFRGLRIQSWMSFIVWKMKEGTSWIHRKNPQSNEMFKKRSLNAVSGCALYINLLLSLVCCDLFVYWLGVLLIQVKRCSIPFKDGWPSPVYNVGKNMSSFIWRTCRKLHFLPTNDSLTDWLLWRMCVAQGHNFIECLETCMKIELYWKCVCDVEQCVTTTSPSERWQTVMWVTGNSQWCEIWYMIWDEK